MSAPSAPQPSNDPEPIHEAGLRGPEIGPAPKRDLLLERVRAARKRLSPGPSGLPRLRQGDG